MDLRDYLQLLLRRRIVLVVAVVVGVAIAYSATDRTSRYETSATLLVSPERFSLETEGSNISFDRIAVIDRLLFTYSRMIKSDRVGIGAAELLNLERSPQSIIGSVSAEVVNGTQLLRITGTDTNPATARDITNAVAQSFIDAVNSPSDTPTEEGGNIPGGVPVSIFEAAAVPSQPLSTGLLGNVLLGAVFGLLVAAGVCIAVDALDVTVRSVHDAEHRLGVPVLGTVPVLRNPSQLLNRTRAEMRQAARASEPESSGPAPPTADGDAAEERARA